MLKALYIFLFVIVISTEGIVFFSGSFDDAKAKARNENKMILLIFASEDDETFIDKLNSNSAFIKLSESYVNLLIKYNTNQWNLLTKLFSVDSSKTLVLCNSDGSERDRVVSQNDISLLTSLLTSYNSNQKTLDYYLNEYLKDSLKTETIAIIASKYLAKGQKDKALEYYSRLIDRDRQERYSIPDYPYYLLSIKKLSDSKAETATKFVRKFPNSKYLNLVYLALADYYIRGEDYKKARSTYDDYLKKFPSDPAALNNFAYLSALLNIELPRAMTSIEKAIIISKDTYSKALYLDTKAEILSKQKKIKEAIEAVELALEIIGNDYKDVRKNLTEQLNKFKNMLK